MGAGLRLCGKLLADAGASVTHVDLAGTENGTSRAAEPFVDGVKRSITLDPDQAADRATLERLLGDAGLYLTSLRHERAARWSLDCDSVVDRHERLVAACVTPFGQSGPYADFASDDVVLSALSGLANATPGFPDRCPPGDPPVQSRARLAESGGAFMAAVAVFGALMPALRGEEGPRHVEVALLEAVVAQMAYEWGITAYGGGVAARHTTHHELEPNVYLPCRDGWVIMVAFTEPHWHSLVELMGSPEWAFEPEYATAQLRGVNYRSLHGLIAEWTQGQLGADVLREAQARGLPCCCSVELAQTLSSEQVGEMGSVTEDQGAVVPADPILVDGRRRPRPAPPASEALGTGQLPARLASSNGSARAPLAGVRVLDLSQIVSGPYAGQLLAALGADVVLVETSQRLISRGFGPFVGEPAYDASAMFNQINQGKRSVELNLANDAGRELLLELVSEADVVLENFSGRAARALGITHEQLREVREDIVLASISGFGRSGPWGDYVALHSGVILLSGLASVTRDSEGRHAAGRSHLSRPVDRHLHGAGDRAGAGGARAHGPGLSRGGEHARRDARLHGRSGAQRRRWRVDRPISGALRPVPGGRTGSWPRPRPMRPSTTSPARRAGRRWSPCRRPASPRPPCSTLPRSSQMRTWPPADSCARTTIPSPDPDQSRPFRGAMTGGGRCCTTRRASATAPKRCSPGWPAARSTT